MPIAPFPPLPPPVDPITAQFIVHSQKAAYAQGSSYLPMPGVPGEIDRFEYLPTTQQEMHEFRPHSWVLSAMWRVREDTLNEAKKIAQEKVESACTLERQRASDAAERFNEEIAQLNEEIAHLRRKVEKYQLIDRIREEALSFSVNTKDLLDLVDDLARMVR